jgi:riboflavin synthase
MFAGVIQGLGKVEKISRVKGNGKAAQMTVDLGKLAKSLKIGDSVSINGACLTVVAIRKRTASFEMVGETMKKTALGSLTLGDRVNIERSLRVGDTIDGHFVLGHVDGVGTIVEKTKEKNQTKLWIKMDKKFIKYVVEKGSIAIDGVSLTVVDIHKDKISVALIPHTLAVTTLGIKDKASKVNLEIDVLSKYARKLLAGKN